MGLRQSGKNIRRKGMSRDDRFFCAFLMAAVCHISEPAEIYINHLSRVAEGQNEAGVIFVAQLSRLFQEKSTFEKAAMVVNLAPGYIGHRVED
jgi:hypothetical protein